MAVACPHRPTCPGCALAEVPYPAQLEAKRARLAAALARYPHLGLTAPAVAPAHHEVDYRHRLKLPVANSRDAVAVGLVDPRTGRVLHTPDCPVLAPRLREGLEAMVPWLRGRDDVHSVDLRVSNATGELAVVLAVPGGSLRGGKGAVRALAAAVPGLVSVALSHADPERKRVMGRKPEVVWGAPHLVERIEHVRYRLYPGAFFQADPRNAAQIHALVEAGVGDAATVLDLYAGVGAYALRLAPGRRRVVAVEEVRPAAAAARAEAPANVEVVAARVEDLPLDEPFDAAILNPARRGADPAALVRLARLTGRLVYVSCGPESLARDLDVLAAHGQRVASLHAVDLFPQTEEVEAVVVLRAADPLTTWPTAGGRAGGPWTGAPSGAIGRATELIVLVHGDPGPRGKLREGSWERLGLVAGHGLLRVRPTGAPPIAVARALSRTGRPLAGDHPPTRRFFAEKAGLVRPFLHVSRAGAATAPLHGDLAQALAHLGAPSALLAAVGA